MEITPQELEELRIKAGIKSKSEAARQIGVTVRAYQKWLEGKNKIPQTAVNYLILLIEYNKIIGKINS